MAARRFRPLRFVLAMAAAALLLFLTRGLWLTALGGALVRDDGPARADIAVVLAGDEWGNRILKGGELVRQGYVPAALVSGPPYYAMHECDAAIAFAAAHGDPPQWFIPFPNSTLSTREEAGAIVSELERRGVHSFLLVTSDYHARRAGRIYADLLRHEAPPMQMRVVAAPDPYFHRDSWWRSREGQKTFLIEWMKTAATGAGM